MSLIPNPRPVDLAAVLVIVSVLLFSSVIAAFPKDSQGNTSFRMELGVTAELERAAPDVLLMQETKLADDVVPKFSFVDKDGLDQGVRIDGRPEAALLDVAEPERCELDSHGPFPPSVSGCLSTARTTPFAGRAARPGLGRGGQARLDPRRHEARLEGDLPVREVRRL